MCNFKFNFELLISETFDYPINNIERNLLCVSRRSIGHKRGG